jgi:hypothetical protein
MRAGLEPLHLGAVMVGPLFPVAFTKVFCPVEKRSFFMK